MVARCRATGTNATPLFGMPATNEAVEFQILYIACVENGKIIERWLLPDLFLTTTRRVGLAPTL
ncbi:MAG: ester cyclase [Rubrobacter sp.]|nr:ester cyclase [Rubrobacter sp.]